jgi:hypothetical protein
MKKLVLVFIIGLLLGTAAFADHDGFGIGVVGGGYGGWGGGFGYPGLSLKIPSIPIFWGIYFPIYEHHFSLGLTGDFYIFDLSLVTKELTNEDGTYKLRLDWYLGLGGFINLYFWWKEALIDFGVRVPIGLSWHIIKQLELFLGVHPGIGFWFGSPVPVHFFIGGELGLRLWLK